MKQQHTLQPKLRFSEFNQKAVIKRAGDIFINYSNKNHDGKLEVLAITQDRGAVPRSLINYDVQVTEEGVSNYKIVEKGNFIISLRSFQGGIEYSDYDGICSPAYIILKSKEEIIDNYFKYYLKTYNYINQLKRTLEGIRDGKMIPYRYFSDTILTIPSLLEQQKIANYLSTIDSKINLLEEKKAQLALYKKAMMQKLFAQEIRFKDDNGNDFPEWEEKRLGEVTFKTDKKNKSNLQLPVYSISNKRGFVPQSEQFDKLDSVERGFDIKLYKIVETDTFAYNPARINVGSIGLYIGQEKVIVSSLYICFKTVDKLLDKFLLVFLDTKSFNNQVLRIAEGGVRQYLFYENFAQIKIPLPSLPEQQKIADFLSAIDESIEKVNEQISQTQSFKKAMLQQMFV